MGRYYLLVTYIGVGELGLADQWDEGRRLVSDHIEIVEAAPVYDDGSGAFREVISGEEDEERRSSQGPREEGPEHGGDGREA
jgi:hypothetical protein